MLEAEKNNQNCNNTYVFQNSLQEQEDMKNITLRTDGRYMARKQINGRQITVYGYNQKQCLQKLKQKIRAVNQKTEPQKQKVFLHQWLDNWYTTYKMKFVSLRTAQIIENAIKEIKKHFSNIDINLLDTQKIQSFLNKYQASRKKEFISLYFNACLQKAEDLDIINKNPFKAVVKDRRINNIRQGYNLEEQTQILNAIKNTQIEPVILFYLCTGIRKNEITTFNIDTDIDIQHNLIKIKSEKKREESYRLIDVTPELIKIILNNREAFKLKTDFIYRQFKMLLDKSNIRSGLHLLRHSFATNHFYLGTPIKLISSWLGHETVELTQNIYTHIDRTITKDDILKLYNNLYYQF